MDLIADIGATNARCALLDASGKILQSKSFENEAHASVAALLRDFIGSARPKRAALAIAGPVTGDSVQMLNIDWRFSQADLKTALGLDTLHVLNDFEALAWSLPEFAATDVHQIGGGTTDIDATRAVLGPGSGFGVGTAARYPGGWTAVGGEGGHVSLPAMSEVERWIIEDHADPNGHCSAERLLSGPGLSRIHSTLARRRKLSDAPISAAEITAGLARKDPLAIDTYAVFFALLGTVAGNLALTVGARGGVFIAGGIVPRVIPELERSGFRERFVARGRYRDYLDAIPTYVVVTEVPAFLGLRSVLRQRSG